jgi:hypothetical protein
MMRRRFVLLALRILLTLDHYATQSDLCFHSVVLNPDGSVVTTEGVNDVMQLGAAAMDKWSK